MKKKLLTIVLTVAISLTVLCSFIACDLDDLKNIINNPENNTQGNGTIDNITDDTSSLVAFSTVSSVIILDTMQGQTALSANLLRDDDYCDDRYCDDDDCTTHNGNNQGSGNQYQGNNNQGISGQELSEEDIAYVQEQLSILDSFMGENAPVVNQSVVAENDEYYGTYEYKMSAFVKDINGIEYSYTMYFNEELHSVKEQNGKFEFESEENFKINGIVISEESTYALSGTKQVEKEQDGFEEESETTYKMRVEKSQTEYIVFEHSQESEGDESEQSFEHKVYQNGTMIKKFELSIENENNENEIEMKSYENGETFTVEYESEVKGGKEIVTATIVKNGERLVVTITPEGDGTEEDPYRLVYTYGDKEHICWRK